MVGRLKRAARALLASPVAARAPVARNCQMGEGAVLHATAVIHNVGEPSRVSIGCFTHVSGILQVFADCGAISIGDYSFLGDNSRIIGAERVAIGNRVQIAHNCSIMDNDVHSLDARARHQEYISNITVGQLDISQIAKKPITIEDDVWIAAHCIILKGVTIGSGAVIGAGSVVTHDIPPMVLAYGNPARIVRPLQGAPPAEKR